MAKDKRTGKEDRGNKKKKPGFIFITGAFAAAIFLIAVIIGSIAYFSVQNNIYGVASKYRKQLETIPLISSALPEHAAEEVSLEYLSNEEVRVRYKELLNDYRALEKELAKAVEKSDNLNNLVLEFRRREDGLEIKEQAFSEKEKKLENQKSEFQQKVALHDRDGFEKYYGEMDAEKAQELYTRILEDKKEDINRKEFAKYYQNMEPDAAAGIFESMGSTKMDVIVAAIENMNRDSASQILQEMDTELASKVTQKLSEIYFINQE